MNHLTITENLSDIDLTRAITELENVIFVNGVMPESGIARELMEKLNKLYPDVHVNRMRLLEDAILWQTALRFRTKMYEQYNNSPTQEYRTFDDIETRD